jgi:hypothetical protein
VKLSVPIVLLGWPLFSLLLFVFLSPRRALIANFVAGWLIIPVASLPFPGFPDFSKTTSMAVGAVLGVLLFDARRLGAFRPRPFDLPALALVLAPFPAAGEVAVDRDRNDAAVGVDPKIACTAAFE